MFRLLRLLVMAEAVALLCWLGPAVSAQQSSFTVGSATAAPGETATGYIDVPVGVDAGMQIPVVVVRGAKPGPVLAIISGSHGTEYASIIAVEQLIQHFDAKELSAQ
ncbi:MAG: hypothetical protein WBE86_10080 [Candidatus Acidiferrales bacterium]